MVKVVGEVVHRETSTYTDSTRQGPSREQTISEGFPARHRMYPDVIQPDGHYHAGDIITLRGRRFDLATYIWSSVVVQVRLDGWWSLGRSRTRDRDGLRP